MSLLPYYCSTPSYHVRSRNLTKNDKWQMYFRAKFFKTLSSLLSLTINYVFNLNGLPYLRGQSVVQLVEALRYKSAGRGFNSRWCHWDFPLT